MLDPSKSNLAPLLLKRLAEKRKDLLKQYPLVEPERNVIIGVKTIMKYLGIRSTRTLYRMIHEQGLPVVPRTDGVLFTTVTSIDDWLFLAAEAAHQDRVRKAKQNGPREDIQRPS